MKTLKISFALLVIAAIIFTGCKKEDPAPVVEPPVEEPVVVDPTTPVITVPMTLFSDNRAAMEQSFTIIAGDFSQISGSKGTQLLIEPNSFAVPGGLIVAGNVEVKLIEVYDKADMVRSNLTTNTATGMLISGGELLIEAWQGTTQLELAAGKTLGIAMPTGAGDPNMGFFTGSLDANDDMVWEEDATTDVSIINDNTTLLDTTMVDTISWDTTSVTWVSSWESPFYYYIDAPNIGYINCDRFPYGSLTPITVEVPEDFDNSNTTVFIYYHSENGVVSLGFDNSTGKFGGMAALGEDVTIIGVAEDGTPQMYSSFTATTIVANQTIALPMNATTQAAFDAALLGLP